MSAPSKPAMRFAMEIRDLGERGIVYSNPEAFAEALDASTNLPELIEALEKIWNELQFGTRSRAKEIARIALAKCEAAEAKGAE